MITYTVEQNMAVIRWHMTSSPMNVLNDESIPTFEAALDNAYADKSVIGVIITSDKPEFVAGADLKMILRNNEQPPADMLKVSTELNRIFRRIETSGKPTVAAINGTALGGGYEICLACHHRIALNNPKTQIGLVEVTLGLLPGGGGTQRLPRMIGIRAALPLLLEGTKLNVPAALQQGLIDEVAETPAALLDKARTWILTNPQPVKPWDQIDPKTGRIVARDGVNVPGGNVQSPAVAQFFSISTARLMAETKGNYPAPLAILSCVYEGLQVNIDRGLAVEGRYFVQVARSTVARHLIATLFLGLNAANKGAGRPQNVPPTDLKRIRIVGGGAIGTELARRAAGAGIDILTSDATSEVGGNEQPLPAPVTSVPNGAELAGCDLILDVVSSTANTKSVAGQEVATPPVWIYPAQTYPAAGQAIPHVIVTDGLILAETDLANTSGDFTNVVGMYFGSSIEQEALVEVIVGEQTSAYAQAVAMDFGRKLRKTPIVVSNSRGFYTARCLRTYVAEGMELLREGTNPLLIENAGQAAGMTLGPLAVYDSLALSTEQTLVADLMWAGTLPDGPGYPFSQQMIRLGRTGGPVGAGFYDYPAADAPAGARKKLWSGLSERFPMAAQQPDLDDVKTRLLYRQALEAVRCLDENVIRTQLDGDLGSILGWGFPSYTGGALSFVDFVGVGTFVRTCDQLAERYGERFRPTESLRKRADAPA